MSELKIEDHTRIIQNCLDNSFLWVTHPLLKKYFINKTNPPRNIIFESLLDIDTIDKKTKELIKNVIVQQFEISKKIKNINKNKKTAVIEIKNPKLFIDIMKGIDSAKTLSELKNTLLYFQKQVSTLKNEKTRSDLKFDLKEKLSKMKFGWLDTPEHPLYPTNIDFEKIKDKVYTMGSESIKDTEENVKEETKDSAEEKESGDISVGITVASNILQDGSKTIYSKKSKITKKSKINVEKLAKDDVKGAITCAIALGLGSAASVSPLTPIAIASGALGGAVANSIGASFDQLWDRLLHRSND